MSQYRAGLIGEQLAEQYLLKLGFKLVDRRFRSRHGEVDLIASKGKTLHFIEVKYRPDSRLGSGLSVITPVKKRRLLDSIKVYLGRKPQTWQLSYLEITRAGILFKADVLHEN
jgi:putative endonuclease